MSSAADGEGSGVVTTAGGRAEVVEESGDGEDAIAATSKINQSINYMRNKTFRHEKPHKSYL